MSEPTVATVDFWVSGIPKPQGSKRAFVHPHTRKPIMVESAGASLRDWRHDLKLTARDQWTSRAVVAQPDAVQLRIEFVMPRPVAMRNKETPPAVKKPDLDKMIRAVCDALKGVVYADDSQVVSMVAFKRTAEPGEPTGARIGIDVLTVAPSGARKTAVPA
ncbi:MAG: RusA family crossover junction endodeoxyribonuclease [Pseudonocardia sp.]|nr:RusA family crossover junction endodeoxyribonuclease [Pseudonocardia sp.]